MTCAFFSQNTSSGAPSSATRPRSITITRSAASASSIKCVTCTSVVPAAASRPMTRMMASRPRTSSSDDGSSSTSTCGSMASAPAMHTRCRCPPLMRDGSLAAYSVRATRRSSRSTRAAISSRGSPRFSGPKATSSATTLVTIWSSGFWKTSPSARRARRYASRSGAPPAQTASPTSSTDPSSGARSPQTTPASVDLPDPFAPSTHTRCPRSILRLTSSSAHASP